jgi:hypothetical protein
VAGKGQLISSVVWEGERCSTEFDGLDASAGADVENVLGRGAYWCEMKLFVEGDAPHFMLHVCFELSDCLV